MRDDDKGVADIDLIYDNIIRAYELFSMPVVAFGNAAADASASRASVRHKHMRAHYRHGCHESRLCAEPIPFDGYARIITARRAFITHGAQRKSAMLPAFVTG